MAKASKLLAFRGRPDTLTSGGVLSHRSTLRWPLLRFSGSLTEALPALVVGRCSCLWPKRSLWPAREDTLSRNPHHCFQGSHQCQQTIPWHPSVHERAQILPEIQEYPLIILMYELPLIPAMHAKNQALVQLLSEKSNFVVCGIPF